MTLYCCHTVPWVVPPQPGQVQVEQELNMKCAKVRFLRRGYMIGRDAVLIIAHKTMHVYIRLLTIFFQVVYAPQGIRVSVLLLV
jgi:hypothetical protein